MSATPLGILLEVVRTLDTQGIVYVVGGSLAAAEHGVVRFTRDADVVVDLREEQVEALARALEGAFYLSRDAMREAVRDRRSFNAIHLDSAFKIDFFVSGTSAFDRMEIERGRAVPSGIPDGYPIRFKTVEDLLIRKLLWYRAGGETSEQQWRDVVGLLALHRDSLDPVHLDRWASQTAVADLLARARADVPPR